MILYNLIYKRVSIAPLVVFRMIFGIMMALSTLRFWLNGWVETQFIQPKFFFHYYGFSWVQPLSEVGVYTIFVLMIIGAIGIAIGAFYRLSSILYFLTFTYVELIDVTNYLNHYYFVSLVAFIMIFLPANKRFSIDVVLKPKIYNSTTEAWTINLIKLHLGIVYFYAGLAKINEDWLLKAQPLRLWLASKGNMYLIGPLLKYKYTAFLFSWFGCIYDLFIPFFLLIKKTRGVAYFMVIVFHIMTGILFPIGMFPYIMIVSTLIFFSESFHEKILIFLETLFNQNRLNQTEGDLSINLNFQKVIKLGLMLFVVFQLLFPFRYVLYPGNLFWTEQGFRFSWRVMLMEKSGNATFYVLNSETGHKIEINNSEYLTPLQEKMMATQPDLILQYAHYLKSIYLSKGIINPKVYTTAYVSLNGRSSQKYIDPSIDLTTLEDTFSTKTWILPFKG